MATSISAGYAFWMDGETINAQLGRTFGVAASWFSSGAAQTWGGVVPCGGAMAGSAGSGMSVNVATGFCVVPSASGALYGAYQFGLLSTGNLTVATSDPTNPRIDLVCATVSDVGTSSSFAEVQIITGTPASSPAIPTLPAASISLFTVYVPANSSSVTSGNIFDARAFTAGIGGIMPVPSLSAIPSGYTGMYLHDRTTGRLVHNPSSGVKQPHILPYAPVLNATTSPVVNSGSETSILTVSFTSDGVADWEFHARWSGIVVASSGGLTMTAVMRLRVDGNQVAVQDVENLANDGTIRGGGTLWHVTSGLVGDTPGSGSHTLEFSFTQGYSGTSNVEVYAGASQPILLYARPAML